MFQFTAEQWVVAISVPLYLVIIAAEMLLSHLHDRKWYTWKDTLHNLVLMISNASIDLAFRATYFLILAYCYEHRVIEISNPWLYWPLLVLAVDFVFYWMHRWEHEIRLLWAVHVTHHNSQLYNFTVGFRSSVFQPLYRFIFFIPIAMLGAKVMDIMLVYSATQIWGILLHTKLVKKLGVLEKFMVTPSHHRVHHASNPLYLDKNMGMFLIIWDRLFGTFQEELSEAEYAPIKFGTTTNEQYDNVPEVVFSEWKQIGKDIANDLPLADRLRYIIGPPGWSHDGSRLTSEQMRHKESGILAHAAEPEPVLAGRQ